MGTGAGFVVFQDPKVNAMVRGVCGSVAAGFQPVEQALIMIISSIDITASS